MHMTFSEVLDVTSPDAPASAFCHRVNRSNVRKERLNVGFMDKWEDCVVEIRCLLDPGAGDLTWTSA